MKRFFALLFILLSLSVLGLAQSSFGGKSSVGGQIKVSPLLPLGGLLDDGLPHPPADYNTFTPPAKGSTYVDTVFGTTIRRVSDYADLNASLTGEYGPHSHANCDGTKYMLIDADGIGYVVVHPTTGAILWQTGISGSSEGYWSQTDPDKFYYRTGNTVRVANINAQTTSLIATFNGTGGLPNCTTVTFGGGDADVSEDGNYLPITCDTKVGMLDLGSLATTPSYRDFGATNENFLWCRVTPDEQFICRLNTTRANTGTVAITNGSTAVVGTSTLFTTEVIQGSYITVSGQQREVVSVTDNTHLTVRTNFTSTLSGQTYSYVARMILFDKNMNFVRAIAPFGGHADVGRDMSGNPVLVIDGANNPNTPPSGCSNNGIYKIQLSDASQTCMIGFPDFNLTGHLSFSNARGHNYVLLTYYDGRLTPTVGTMMFSNVLRSDWADVAVWKKYYNEAILVKTDGSEIRRLANTRTRIPMSGSAGAGYADYYWFSARGSLSKLISANGYPAYFEFASNMNTKVTKTLSGTVSTTSGSATVTGSGTTFSGLSSGQAYIPGNITINGVTKEIATVDSTTSLTTTTTWGSTLSGQTATASGPRAGINAYVGSIDAPLSDVTAPTLSSISAGTPGTTTATITWTSNEAATSQVEWGTTTYYGSGISAFDLTKVTSHSVNLTGLTGGTTYHYRVKSRDAAGNYSSSSDNTFATSGGASDFVTDALDDSDTNALDTHTGAVGATWTHHPAAAYTGNQFIFASNRIYPNNTTAYYASGTPPSADYYVQADVYAASVISVNAGPCLRMDTTNDTMYCVRLNNGTSWDLRKIVAGSGSTLGTSTNQLPSASQFKTVKLTVAGSVLTVQINGTQEISFDDSGSPISGAGKAGIRASGIASSSTGFHIDNFSAR